MHDMDLARNKTADDQVQLGRVEHSGQKTPFGRGHAEGVADAQQQLSPISETGPCVAGPGVPANGLFHHYMFELFALDTKGVQPTTDAFETDVDVIKGKNIPVENSTSFLRVYVDISLQHVKSAHNTAGVCNRTYWDRLIDPGEFSTDFLD
jgi:hypothetical protein